MSFTEFLFQGVTLLLRYELTITTVREVREEVMLLAVVFESELQDFVVTIKLEVMSCDVLQPIGTTVWEGKSVDLLEDLSTDTFLPRKESASLLQSFRGKEDVHDIHDEDDNGEVDQLTHDALRTEG